MLWGNFFKLYFEVRNVVMNYKGVSLVVVIDFKMGFWLMVFFMVKVLIVVILVIIIVLFIVVGFFVVFGGFLVGFFLFYVKQKILF